MIIIIATTNVKKRAELEALLGSDYEVHGLESIEKPPEVEENADTFVGNASLKALAISQLTPHLVIADDSGLCVDALDGAPGIYSARYANESQNGVVKSATDETNNEKLLRELSDVTQHPKQRGAHFVCALVIAQQGEVLASFEGKVEGHIAEELSGQAGFGYDPLFVPHGYEKSFADLGSDIKQKISHRAHALSQLKNWLVDK